MINRPQPSDEPEHEVNLPADRMSLRERIGGASLGVGALAGIFEAQRLIEHAPIPRHLMPLGALALASAGLVWSRLARRRG